VKTLRRGRGGEEAGGGVVVKRALAEGIAGEEKRGGPPVPAGEGIVAEDPFERLDTPCLQAGQQERRVGQGLGAGLAAEPLQQLFAIVEPDIGDERETAVRAGQRLAVIFVFREELVEDSAERNVPETNFGEAVGSIDLLPRQHVADRKVRARSAAPVNVSSDRGHRVGRPPFGGRCLDVYQDSCWPTPSPRPEMAEFASAEPALSRRTSGRTHWPPGFFFSLFVFTCVSLILQDLAV
jgi:hypothetical protein